MQLLKKIFANALIVLGLSFGLIVSAVAKPVSAKINTAVIYGTPYYPSDYSPEMIIYARNVETGKTYPFKVAQDAEQYKMILPAPATYIFFSWTTEKTGSFNDVDIKMGAVLSECDGSSYMCDEHDFSKHFPRPVTLRSGQVINNLEISNYYYPHDKTHMFVPKP